MNKRRYGSYNRTLGKGLLTFMIVAALAIAAGYGLTEYVITPYFLGAGTEEPGEGNGPQQELEGSSIIVDQQDVNTEGGETPSGDSETPAPAEGEPGTETGTDVVQGTAVFYCIQYGSFSDMAGAEAMASTLAASDIPVTVVQKDGAYKLIGAPHVTKEEARLSLEKVKPVAGDDLFVTTVEVRMQ